MVETSDLKKRIIEYHENFSKGEKKVSKYVIDNFSEIIQLSVTELAIKASVSNATVIRFAKSLGFKGYLDFRRNLKKINITRNPYDYLKKMESKYNSKFIDDYLVNLQNDMNRFSSLLEYSTIDAIAKQLLGAETVYLIGIGSDSVVATFLYNYLGLMDINTRCIREGGMPMKEALYRLSAKDVIFISGYPQILKDEKWVSDFAKSRNAKLISITDSLITSTYLQSDLTVIAKESTETFFNSYVLPLTICNVLLLRLYEKSPERVESSLKKYSELLNDEEV